MDAHSIEAALRGVLGALGLRGWNEIFPPKGWK